VETAQTRSNTSSKPYITGAATETDSTQDSGLHEKNQRVEAKRLKCSTKEKIKGWFSLLDNPIVRAIHPENCWNADEGGVMEGRSDDALTLAKGCSGVIAEPGSVPHS
jgi:hypothetical protein